MQKKIGQLVKLVPTRIRTCIQNLNASLTSTTLSPIECLDHFVNELLENTVPQLNLFLKTVDKKREKQYMSQVKDDLYKHIPHLIDPESLFGSLYQYMFLDKKQSLLHLSWKHVLQLVQQNALGQVDDDSDMGDINERFVSAYHLVNAHFEASSNKKQEQAFEDRTKMEQLLSSLKKSCLKE
jgi:hypothetical protein